MNAREQIILEFEKLIAQYGISPLDKDSREDIRQKILNKVPDIKQIDFVAVGVAYTVLGKELIKIGLNDLHKVK